MMATPLKRKSLNNSSVSNDSIRSILLASLDESEDEIPNDDDGEGFLNTSPAGRGSLFQENTGLLSRLIDYSDDSDLDPDYLPGVSAPSSSDEEQASTSTGIKRKKPSKKKNPLNNSKKKQLGQEQEKSPQQQWIPGPFLTTPFALQQPAYLEIERTNWDAARYVEQYLDDDDLSTVVDKTNQTAIFKTGKTLGLTVREMKVWLGVNFLMSALQMPQIRMHWEKKWRFPLIAKAMTRDRYFLIRNSLKVVFDNDIDQNGRNADRFWKVRPLISRIRQGCMKQPRSQELSIDEMMVPFCGNCKVKQYIPNKPNPEGIKVLVLANPNGLICDFTLYQGKNTYSDEANREFSLCENDVLQLCSSLVPGHIIYIDRYFTTVKLGDELLNRGLRCSGTIRKDRVPKETGLPDDKTIKKQQKRGSCVVSVRGDGKMAITKWVDNNVVTMFSTHESTEPQCQVKRWSKTENRYVILPQPKVINSYNCNMGGVDLADRMISYCPSRARTNKWTVRCILHFLDVALSNAWIQMREDKRNAGVPQKQIPQFRRFKLDYGQMLIEQNKEIMFDDNNDEVQTQNCDRRSSSDPTIAVRTTGMHLPEVSKGYQKRCANAKCSKKSTIFCVRCNVYLCLVAGRNCFRQYHSVVTPTVV